MNIATKHDDMFPVNPKLAWDRLRIDYKKALDALEQRCACRFVGNELEGAREQTEWCGRHSQLRKRIKQLEAALRYINAESDDAWHKAHMTRDLKDAVEAGMQLLAAGSAPAQEFNPACPHCGVRSFKEVGCSQIVPVTGNDNG